MKVVFRVDASNWIGTGHVMRCLSLAEELQKNLHEVIFACISQRGDMINLIENRDFCVCSLTAPSTPCIPNHTDYKSWLLRSWEEDSADFIQKIKDADIVVVDHYAIGSEWHSIVKSTFDCKIIVIDDLVREHCAEVVIDQTLDRHASDYSGVARVLAGSNYALLSADFSQKHEIALDRALESNPLKIMVYMGGVDIPNATHLVLETLTKNLKATYTVLLGNRSPHYTSVKNFCDSHKEIEHLDFSENIAGLMLDHDIAIGAAGTSSWERACVGLPSIIIPIAENQRDNAERLQKAQAAILVKMERVSTDLKPAIVRLQKNWRKHCDANLAICDGRGVARIMLEIDSVIESNGKTDIELVDATIEDSELVYRWQSMPETRKYSLNPNVPNRMEHQRWMKKKLGTIKDYFFIVQERLSKRPCGFIRLDRKNNCSYLVSIAIIPEFHGQGYGLAVLKSVDKIFANCYLHAVVKVTNLASQKLFKKAGYKKLSNENFIREPIIRSS